MSSTSASHRFRKIKEIYLRVADQETGRRRQLVAEACGGDRDLAAEVLELLALTGEPTGTLGVMDRIGRRSGSSTSAATAAEGGSAEIGARALLASLEGWDRFTDLELIGRGGMGVVFRAWDPRLKRRVALKFLNRPTPRATARFRHEAELQARVDHDHVLDVYETGDACGHPYLAMKLVNGGGLASVRARTTLAAKLELMGRIAGAVHAAHRLGLVHRDLKPSNILVETTPRGFKPWVTDFGIAADLGGPAPTGSFQALGSPRYMAPEQLEKDAKLDPRTDVYGLGATFYELLAGAPPFHNRSIVELLIEVRRAPVPRLREVAPEVPPEVEAVVMRCLEKDPARRYPSAAALASDLERLARQRSPGPGRPGTRRAVRGGWAAASWQRRRRRSSSWRRSRRLPGGFRALRVACPGVR